METKLSRSKKILALTQSAIFIALATVLSFLPVYEMPMGGSVTLASMLPILFIGLKFGYKWGFASSAIYAFIQLAQALIKGNVFIWCTTATTVIVCVLFDYIVPFSILGFSALARNRLGEKLFVVKVSVVFSIIIAVRFLCHYITGVAIWGQWAPDGMGKYLYSFLYNGGFLSVDFAILLVVLVLMLKSEEVKKLIERVK